MIKRGKRAGHETQQDLAKMSVWGARTEVAGAGAVMRVRGTHGEDSELPVVNFGYSFNLSTDANAEVITMNMGSDPNQMFAFPTLPRDAQRAWPEGTGGVQHPTDGGRYFEFNANETHLSDGTFVVGTNRELVITVDGANVTLTTGGNMTLTAGGNMTLNAAQVDINSGALNHNTIDVGDSHRHSGVVPGPSDTGVPVP